MIYCNQTQIGVIACPGGAYFAREVISHLKDISVKRFRKNYTGEDPEHHTTAKQTHIKGRILNSEGGEGLLLNPEP